MSSTFAKERIWIFVTLQLSAFCASFRARGFSALGVNFDARPGPICEGLFAGKIGEVDDTCAGGGGVKGGQGVAGKECFRSAVDGGTG